MTLAYDLDIDDLMAFQEHFFKTNKVLRRSRKIVQWLFPALFMLIAFLGRDMKHGFGLFLLIYLGVVSVLWILFMPRLMKRSFVKKIRKTLLKPANAIFFGWRRMTFGQDGVRTQSDMVDDTVKWKAFTGWIRVNGYCFLYLSQSSAYVIPECRLSAQETESLMTFLHAHVPQQTVK